MTNDGPGNSMVDKHYSPHDASLNQAITSSVRIKSSNQIFALKLDKPLIQNAIAQMQTSARTSVKPIFLLPLLIRRVIRRHCGTDLYNRLTSKVHFIYASCCCCSIRLSPPTHEPRTHIMCTSACVNSQTTFA